MRVISFFFAPSPLRSRQLERNVDDARFVAFFSAATNLVPGDTNAAVDLFLRGYAPRR